jgi:hypothetical protein
LPIPEGHPTLSLCNVVGSSIALLDKLAAEKPDAVEAHQALAESLSQYGEVLAARHRPAEAAAAYRRAVAVSARLADEKPQAPQYKQLFGESCFRHAGLLAGLPAGAPPGDDCRAEAVALLRRARQAGFFAEPGHVEGLKNNPDLAPLRARPDFRQLLTELEAR